MELLFVNWLYMIWKRIKKILLHTGVQDTEYPDGGKYEGEFKDGLLNGQGTLTFPDGLKYEGEFKDGEEHGQGTVTLPDGTKYEGEFKDGEIIGIN